MRRIWPSCVCVCVFVFFFFFFFFQAEDGIRDHCVTGVQTCALPILCSFRKRVIATVVPTSGSPAEKRIGGQEPRISPFGGIRCAAAHALRLFACPRSLQPRWRSVALSDTPW